MPAPTVMTFVELSAMVCASLPFPVSLPSLGKKPVTQWLEYKNCRHQAVTRTTHACYQTLRNSRAGCTGRPVPK